MEIEQLSDGDVGIVGDPVKGGFDRVGESAGVDLRSDELLPTAPIALALGFDKDDRRRLGLARLQKGEELEALVERSEASREDEEARRLLDQHQLARKEVLHFDELAIVGYPLVRLSLARKADVDADRHL